MVLCVAATGQSGSTILTRMLGEVPGFFAAGEVGRVWDKGLAEDITCSCGAPFSACEFWSKVGERAFGGWQEVDGPATARLRVSLSADHRISDGAEVARFLQAVKGYLEKPLRLVL